MSLKGYQWLIDNKVVMSYLFKDEVLDIWQKVENEEIEKFKEYISPLEIIKIEDHTKEQDEKQES